MALDHPYNFRCDDELDNMIKDALASLDVDKSELLRNALMVGLPAVTKQPVLFFGAKCIPGEDRRM